MSALELAMDFTSLLKRGLHDAGAAKYNADDIVSYEAMDGPMAVCKGGDAVKKKGEWWVTNHEVHDASVEGPYVNGDEFIVRFKYDVTEKASGNRIKLDEVGVYKVAKGKIVSERFFYAQG